MRSATVVCVSNICRGVVPLNHSHRGVCLLESFLYSLRANLKFNSDGVENYKTLTLNIISHLLPVTYIIILIIFILNKYISYFQSKSDFNFTIELRNIHTPTLPTYANLVTYSPYLLCEIL